MATVPTLVIRPVTSLGVSRLLVMQRDADGAESEVLAGPGADAAAVTAAIEQWAAAAPDPVAGILVDLEFCEWVDSGVLGTWVAWHHALAARGGRVVVCRANERIRNILRVSQLDQLFATHGTLDAAVAALQDDPGPA